MPSFRVASASADFVADLTRRLERAASLLEGIVAIATSDPLDPFGSPVVDPNAPILRRDDSVADLPILLAIGGVHLVWAADEPRYEIGNPAGARHILRAVADGLGCDKELIVVSVAPDLSEVTRALMSAVTSGNAVATDDLGHGDGKSRLPGLGELDEQQRAAVLVPRNVDLLINAAAGSGKTHTLAFRLAHLVAESGLQPDRCIALSFSRAARSQIEGRLRLLATQGYPQLGSIEVRTLHSLSLRLLMLAASCGKSRLRRGFRIVEIETEQQPKHGSIRVPAPFIRRYDELFDGIEDQLTRSDRLSLYPAVITALRNGHPDLGVVAMPEALPFDRIVNAANPRNGQFVEMSPVAVRTVWTRYEAAMSAGNQIDLGGLVPEALISLTAHPDLLNLITGAYDLVFVDEYQDTTKAQDELLLLLAASGMAMNVVGDGDQTISTFAGAYEQSITGFAQRLHSRLGRDVIVLPLETNYRSRPEIVSLANGIIERNENRLEKTMRPHDPSPLEEGHVLRVEGELRYIASWVGAHITSLIDAGVSPSEIAVLYRKEGERSPQMSSVVDHLTSLQVQICQDDTDEDGVRVLTIHRAKGREFDHVFVLYLRAGDFPDRRGALEEERRLLYVAITRARKHVYACGLGGGEPDFFGETLVPAALPVTKSIRTMVSVLEGAALDELHDTYDGTDVDDWDESL